MTEFDAAVMPNGEVLDPVAPAEPEPAPAPVPAAQLAADAPRSVAIPEDAIIFVPGIGASESVQLPHVADLLCWELNLQAPDRAMTFASKPTSVGGEVVHRIERTDGLGGVTGVADVYGYDVVAELDRGPESTNPIWRVLSLGLTLVGTVLQVAGATLAPWRRQKSFGQLLQVLVVLLILLFIALYFVFAVFALIQAIATAVAGNSTESAISWPQWIVLVGAVIGALVPNIRDRINWLGKRSVQMAHFASTAPLRNRLSGGVLDLVDRVAQRPDIKRVHLVGYSFGSLVTLEAVYPQGGQTGQAVKIVDTLTTIGSPFGIVCMVRPTYRERIALDDDIKPRWLNIYQPIDALGFDFRASAKADAAEYGLLAADKETRTPDDNVEWDPDLKLNLANFLMLRSLSVHAGYWDSSKTARSALGLLVANLVRRHPKLVGADPADSVHQAAGDQIARDAD